MEKNSFNYMYFLVISCECVHKFHAWKFFGTCNLVLCLCIYSHRNRLSFGAKGSLQSLFKSNSSGEVPDAQN